MITADLAPWRCLAVVKGNCLLAGWLRLLGSHTGDADCSLAPSDLWFCLLIYQSRLTPLWRERPFRKMEILYWNSRRWEVQSFTADTLTHSGILKYLSWLCQFDMLWYMCQPIPLYSQGTLSGWDIASSKVKTMQAFIPSLAEMVPLPTRDAVPREGI